MNIYISNLSFRVDDNDLNELFASYGEVLSAKVVMDRESGRSRGFAFVEMADEQAKKAIEELDQAEYDGKVISVSEARPRENKPQRNNNNRNFNRDNNKSGGGYNRNNNNNKRW